MLKQCLSANSASDLLNAIQLLLVIKGTEEVGGRNVYKVKPIIYSRSWEM